MTNPDNHNGEVKAPAAIATLADLMTFLASAELALAKRAEMRSAIKRADELVGHGALDHPADAALILKKLTTLSPAMVGMSPAAFANLKSRVRAAFRLAEPRLEHPRARGKLTGRWAELQAGLPPRARLSLSRLFHFAHGQGWAPAALSDAHIERFGRYLRETALVVDWENVVRFAICDWNRLASQESFGDLNKLTPPARKRTPYWIDVAAWPTGLRAGMEAFLAHLAKPSGFMEASVRKLKPKTIEQYRHMIVTLVSAAVTRGVDLGSMPRLVDTVAPDNLNRALIFLHQRSGGQITSFMRIMAIRARVIATWGNAPPETLAGLDNIIESLRCNGGLKRGITAKNRSLLDRLDDERFRDLILLMPQMLADKAKAKKRGASSLALMRTAVAVELLLTCSMRRENLVTLEFDRSIRKIGHGPKACWIIEILEESVKNGEPLRFKLPDQTADLLETYLADWRPRLSNTPGPWLFPGPNRGPIDPKTMAAAIERCALQVVGCRITPHQFRHISAELFLRAKPDALATVSEHLGHRDINTTREYYTRPKQREASRRFQEHVVLDRAGAQGRLRIGKRRRAGRSEIDDGDVL